MNLTFSNNPAVVTYTADEYQTPVRTSSCDVEIVTPEILSSLWTGKRDELWVEIRDNNSLVWEGYITPNMYSQEVSQNLDTVTITCIDNLAMLKYISVNELFQKKTYTIGDILNTVIQQGISSTRIYIESPEYDGHSFLEVGVDMNNFYDENEDGTNCLEMLTGILKLFNLSIFYFRNSYFCLDMNNTGNRHIYFYDSTDSGLVYRNDYTESNPLYSDWTTVNPGNMSIGEVYGDIRGTISTRTKSYGHYVADDMIPDSESFYIGEGNILLNKSQGWDMDLYESSSYTAPPSYHPLYKYVFNGLYADDRYLLRSVMPVNGYNNINTLQRYVWDEDSRGTDRGTLLNIMGQKRNPLAEDKTSPLIRDVEVNNCITTYAVDNGIPPEFRDPSDFEWEWNTSSNRMIKTGQSQEHEWGKWLTDTENYEVYRQKLEGITLRESDDNRLKVDWTYRYSRTGLPEPVGIIFDSSCETGIPARGPHGKWFPYHWGEENIKFNTDYFLQMNVNGIVAPVFDWHPVEVRLIRDNTHHDLWFDGREWSINQTRVELGRLINEEQVFQVDKGFDYIKIGNDIYALNGEATSYWVDHDGNYVGKEKQGLRDRKIEYQLYDWNVSKYIDETNPFTLILPKINADVDIQVKIYSGRWLGTSGVAKSPFRDKLVYKANGDNQYVVNDVDADFTPFSATYIKAQHSKINIQFLEAESNAGKIYDRSDIQYRIKNNNWWLKTSTDFMVNTYNDLVKASSSYLSYNGQYCDPNKFTIGGITGRPESYVLCAISNTLGQPRKVYDRTLVSEGSLRPLMRITGDEVDADQMVISSYSWDVKTDRLNVEALESTDLKVQAGQKIEVKEIPHLPRNERY